MARRPQPVDPADGPIPAFAYDLRLVREEAGNPTYRALAALAGFSATTLSDAARGVRQPSLEVTLAYVGACGGDVAHWQQRWRALDLQLAQDRGTPEPEPAKPAEPEPEADLEPVSVAPRRLFRPFPHASRWPHGSGVAAVAVLAAAFALLGLLVPRLGRATGPAEPVAATASPPPAHCEGTDPTPAAFHGTAYSPTTRIRAGASLSSTVLRQVSGSCRLEFTGYCLGDVVTDATAGSPDMRWLQVSGGGLVASAVIHGNPPAGMQPGRCPEDSPAPASITLSITPQPANPDLLQLTATGRHLAIVGFAAYFAPDPAGSGGPGASAPAPRWQQLGLTDEAAAGFAVTWRFGPLRGHPGAPEGVPVVAVACLGGDGPTDTVDARRVLPADPGRPQPAPLGADDLRAAGRAACHYPTTS